MQKRIIKKQIIESEANKYTTNSKATANNHKKIKQTKCGDRGQLLSQIKQPPSQSWSHLQLQSGGLNDSQVVLQLPMPLTGSKCATL